MRYVGWTPVWFGETTGEVTVVWEVAWYASNGQSGMLDPLEVTTSYVANIDEIQTIGIDN
jgi:hypothetical protein